MLRSSIYSVLFLAMLFSFQGCARRNTLVPIAQLEVQEEEKNINDESTEEAKGREPASMTGNAEWLNEVQDDFSRIAAETSSRSLASKKNIVLVKNPRWQFQQDLNTNQFSLKLDGKTYSMLLANPGEENNFSLAAEGQTESPITLIVTAENNRSIAQVNNNFSEEKKNCNAELNFWDKRAKKHQKDFINIKSNACITLIERLRSFVP